MIISKHRHNIREVSLGIAILLTMAGRVVSNGLLFLAIVFYLYTMLKGTDFENFEVGLLLIPCVRLFDIIGISYTVNLLLFFPILVHMLRNRKIVRNAFIHTVVLCMLEFLHCIVLNNTENIVPNLSAISLLYFCEILLYRKEEYDPINIFRWLSFGAILSAGTYLLDVVASRSRDIFYFINHGIRFEAFANDPNYYSMYICIAIAAFFSSKNNKWYDIGILVIDFFFGLITLSKMSLIIIVFVFTANGFRQLSSIERKKRRVYRAVVLVTFAAIVFNINRINVIISNILVRTYFSSHNHNLALFTTGRSTLVFGYIRQLFTNPVAFIWGYGFQYVKYIGVAMNVRYRNNVSHNTFLDIFLSWGIIGAVIVGIIIFRIVSKSFDHEKKYSFYDKLPLYCFVFSLFSLSCLSSGMFWYMVAASLLTVKNTHIGKVLAFDEVKGV